jgi:four helix bundle protein
MQNEQAAQLEERLIDLAVRIIGLAGLLPRSYAGNHVAGQILRSGTAPAPNYGEARGSESRADFVHKLDIALKELNETQIWLKVIQRSALAPAEAVLPISDECGQLSRMINASVQTARRNGRQQRPMNIEQ